MSLEILQADARHLPLPDESVQCIVTSPPYWGLRKYQGEQESVWGGTIGHLHLWTAERRYGGGRQNGKERWNYTGHGEHGHESVETNFCECGAWKGAYGLEPAIDLYIEHTVTILRELRRVLRNDGVLFWNIGDSYSASNRGSGGHNPKQDSNRGSWTPDNHRGILTDGLKPKDLCLIPERVALAAQADGWWVRSRILWCKPNPMPESVTDRPTDAAEHIWMFTKSERYFWDADAVREQMSTPPEAIIARVQAAKKAALHKHLDEQVGGEQTARIDRYAATTEAYCPSGRNLRNVWTFPTQPYSGAHFATFPEEIPRRAILAATSAKGACAQCGAPWERVTRQQVHFEGGTGRAMSRDPESWHGSKFDTGKTAEHQGQRMQLRSGKYVDDAQAESGDYDIRMGPVVDSQTIGWQPTCLCRRQHGKTVPCVVLDPFAGSGTTGRVAIELNRRAILADIAYGEGDEYRRLAEERTTEVQRNLIGIEGVSV